MKTYWLTPKGADRLDTPISPGGYESSMLLHDIFDGSDKRGITALDLYLHGFDWKFINKLVGAGLLTSKFSKAWVEGAEK